MAHSVKRPTKKTYKVSLWQKLLEMAEIEVEVDVDPEDLNKPLNECPDLQDSITDAAWDAWGSVKTYTDIIDSGVDGIEEI